MRTESFVSRWIFLRALGVIYSIAFLSLLGQVAGLIGPQGILPSAHYLPAALHQVGTRAHWLIPTVFWWGTSVPALKAVCLAGAVCGLLVTFDVAVPLALIACWTLYLSLMSVSGDFLSFQWDALLLETGFLSIFLTGLRFKPRLKDTAPPSTPVLWLFRWLLFRLMFSSGWVKLASGDVSWRHLTALRYHFETQPLPFWSSWYWHQLPPSWQTFSVAVVFFVELIVPFFIFGTRRMRARACGIIAGFQVLVMITGNYAFFNWLAIALCLVVIDDEMWPETIRRWLAPSLGNGEKGAVTWPTGVIWSVTALVLTLSTMNVTAQLRRTRSPGVLGPIRAALAPFGISNNYGLFAVMTTTRLEIVIEGSSDGKVWVPYEFRYKPGDPLRRPELVAPYQPRLDWQMWFAALGTYEDNPWFINLCIRLLQGSPDVVSLMGKNPFPDAPPQFIRAQLYRYRFSDPETREETGAWWVREEKGPYLRAISLRDFSTGH